MNSDVVMRPQWRDLLFLHWPVAPEILQKTLPPGLAIETFDGKAYVGLVPFQMENVRPRFVPDLGKMGRFYDAFPELNVRTYVTCGGVPGVWFHSLDCASFFATFAARLWFKLPYFKSHQRFWRARNGDFHFDSRRLFPHPKPAHFSGRWRTEGEIAPAKPASLEEFLVERYVLYSRKNGQLFRGRVAHAPYQIQSAQILKLRENCVAQAGIARPNSPPHALFSRGVDVEVFPLEIVEI